MVYGLAARSAANAGADTATALSPVNARRSFFIIEPHNLSEPKRGSVFATDELTGLTQARNVNEVNPSFQAFLRFKGIQQLQALPTIAEPGFADWMDKSWPAADPPHCNRIFDARCACCATRRVFGRCVAQFTLARSRTRTIANCCNCNGMRRALLDAPRRSPISFRRKRGRLRAGRLSPTRYPLNWAPALLGTTCSEAHQEHLGPIARGAMVGKQIKSLFVRLEEYEPHIPAAQGASDFGRDKMRACWGRRHNLHGTSPGKENLDAMHANEKTYYRTMGSMPRREIIRSLVFVCGNRPTSDRSCGR